ncbi:MAG: neutral zinc metallopeptidase [Nocardia sp.]|nr:neutral zinc metallopeptidase [Nocardia sp.]
MIKIGIRQGIFAATDGGDSGGGTSSAGYRYSPTPTMAPGSAGSAGPGTTGVAATGTNPLLAAPGAPLSPAACRYPKWGTDVSTARAFFESTATCLAAEWKPVLAKHNLPFVPPKLSVTASTAGISTPCTGNSTNFAAFYCSADQTIYIPISQLQTDLIGDKWEVYVSVFAHEYGHHIQALAGILGAANRQRAESARSTSLEISRRIELQAQCLDGMHIASSAGAKSLSAPQVSEAKQDAYERGDSGRDMRDHGTTQHSGQWWDTGFGKDNTAQCNTFIAPAGQVS